MEAGALPLSGKLEARGYRQRFHLQSWARAETSERRAAAGNGCQWKCRHGFSKEERQGYGPSRRWNSGGLMVAGNGCWWRHEHGPLLEAGVRLLEWRRGRGPSPGETNGRRVAAVSGCHMERRLDPLLEGLVGGAGWQAAVLCKQGDMIPDGEKAGVYPFLEEKRGVACPAWSGGAGVAPPGDASGRHVAAGSRILRRRGT